MMENEKDIQETPAEEKVSSPAAETFEAEKNAASPLENESSTEKAPGESAPCCCCCKEESSSGEEAKEEEKDSCGADEEEKDEGKEERRVRRERVNIPITDEMVDKTRVALVTMLDYLGLEGTVKAEGRTSKINLYVNSDDAGRIIGRKGQTLESLQLILNKMMQKENPDFPKVYIDLDGYASRNERRERSSDRAEGEKSSDKSDRGERSERGSRRRSFEDRPPRRNSRREFSDDGQDVEDNLRQQALDAAKEVRRWGEPKTLPPMNSHDRRIIHITLENEEDLVTESSGEGLMKSVTISLKK
ncbi:MAG: KH domain-containing protein [Lentisphaeria bacterium]|nr:KH domain-containing protein [Lentisphaeria bacterium]